MAGYHWDKSLRQEGAMLLLTAIEIHSLTMRAGGLVGRSTSYWSNNALTSAVDLQALVLITVLRAMYSCCVIEEKCAGEQVLSVWSNLRSEGESLLFGAYAQPRVIHDLRGLVMQCMTKTFVETALAISEHMRHCPTLQKGCQQIACPMG
nr:hypothetical protein CFP56_77555 [Quercus suber]